ncbi:hypothetical protein R3P38DRAFT_3270579 [Favolaschia claudopus]|uniref:F-box domain-containing protein n=1 Tax=Favolaschia claudopus TaxID=2862362 RepID=A0AAW0B9R5_9AGAR
MSATPSFSVREIVEEQMARTKQSTKSQIESFIEKSESTITPFGHQIAALKLRVEELNHLCDNRRTIVTALHFLIAPIRALPVELLAQIFSWAIRRNSSIRDAARLPQVCLEWRQIAFTTPRLWIGPISVRISWRVGSDSEPKQQLHAEGLPVEIWIARSAFGYRRSDAAR